MRIKLWYKRRCECGERLFIWKPYGYRFTSDGFVYYCNKCLKKEKEKDKLKRSVRSDGTHISGKEWKNI